jgi:hypothetical protein
MASTVSAGRKAAVSSARQREANAAASETGESIDSAGPTWRPDNNARQTGWTAETDAFARKTGEPINSARPAGRTDNDARATGRSTETDDASSSAGKTSQSAEHAGTARISACHAERKTCAQAQRVFWNHGWKTGEREGKSQLKSAGQNTERAGTGTESQAMMRRGEHGNVNEGIEYRRTGSKEVRR